MPIDDEISPESAATPHEAVRLLMEQRSMILGFIHAIVRDSDAAEEVFQEVCVAVCESYAGFEPGTNFGAWAREIARRRIFAHRRKQARLPVALTDAGLARLQMGFDQLDEEVHSVGHMRLRALRQCLQQVGARQRKLIAMRYEDRMSLSAIAERMARQPESVRKALYRTREALKGCIDHRVSLGMAEA